MKKFLFFALAAAFAFTSCTQDETLATAQNGAIDFAVAADKATRSVYDPSITTNGGDNTTAIDNFSVYGFMNEATGVVFNDEIVTKQGGAWTYANTQYWTPNTYYFAALAPANGRAWELTAASGDAAKLGVGTIDFTNDGTQDLLYWAGVSDNTANAVENQPVSILFNHLLSKVKFSFVNQFDNANASIVVKNIVITNAETKGTLNLAVENWWDGENDWSVNTTANFAFGNAAVASETAEEKIAQYTEIESYKHLLLFPVNEKEFEITFEVDLYMGGVKANAEPYRHTVKVTTTLEMGKAYDFKAILNASNVTGNDGEELKPIEFEVEVIDWIEAGEVVVPNSQKVAATEAELVAALALGGEVILTNDIEISTTLNITNNALLNLNGKTIKNKLGNTNTDVIVVAEGDTLTIVGEGTIEAVTGNDGYAVIADGTLIINGGTFKSGVDANNAPNAVIYARNNGRVYVNGGYFPNDNASKFVLNKKDADRATTVIEVRGGKFGTFNPANNAAEEAGTNFVAEGYESVEVETNVWEVRAK